ncbi:hypothetical protein ASPFODRAFT_51084, partial [Aspergillus luchuensis CBS 106.47]
MLPIQSFTHIFAFSTYYSLFLLLIISPIASYLTSRGYYLHQFYLHLMGPRS